MDKYPTISSAFQDEVIEYIFDGRPSLKPSFIITVTYTTEIHFLECMYPSMRGMISQLTPEGEKFHQWIHFDTKEEALKYQSELYLVDIAKFIPEDLKKLKAEQ